MPAYIGLADVELSVHDEYYSGIDAIYLGIYEADSEEEALTKIKNEWDNPVAISDLGDWVVDRGYHIKVVKVD